MALLRLRPRQQEPHTTVPHLQPSSMHGVFPLALFALPRFWTIPPRTKKGPWWEVWLRGRN